MTNKIEKTIIFIKDVVVLWNTSNLKAKNIEVTYLGDKLFDESDMLEKRLIFKRRNALLFQFCLFIPSEVNQDIYKRMNKDNNYSIIDSLEYYLKAIVNGVISIYNLNNPKSHLSLYRTYCMGISNNIFKKHIYKVQFEISGKMEYIYLNIDESQV
ncbi:MAG: hypothetical protein U9R16_02660, partial [Campylobacterota bacterium]|nr:hypothetical protein [Campylobacterota bacterium]